MGAPPFLPLPPPPPPQWDFFQPYYPCPTRTFQDGSLGCLRGGGAGRNSFAVAEVSEPRLRVSALTSMDGYERFLRECIAGELATVEEVVIRVQILTGNKEVGGEGGRGWS